ncbi:MAG: hypothetical protein Q4P07_09915 [Ornithinimicrobium sp.]|uniref:pilus assembly protein TadG-related protein n=1 Tax=Ornithinimicrobium sp. TaxID=1977084 RepID=UPI0026E01C31|nr:pilus assembly protein TadG-related protein [Ornithinimicrobium sp.]MDO5740451.1 hypothetical protein [Ornithinimicrobium sp.]
MTAREFAVRWTTCRPQRDAGQAALLLVFSVAVLMSIAVALIAIMGRGVTVETEARTASDAAALAAAQGYVDAVEDHLGNLPVTPGLAIGHVRQILDQPRSAWTTRSKDEAARLAAANGSRLTAYTVNPAPLSLRFVTKSRATAVTVEGGSKRPEFDATAEVRLTGGPLCFRNGDLGLWWAGECLRGEEMVIEPPVVEPPTEEPTPTIPPDPDGPVIIGGDDLTTLLNLLRQPITWQVALVE